MAASWVYRWETNCGLHDRHRSGWPSKITFEMVAFMEAKMEEDDEITSAELHRLISRHFSANISPPPIKRYIRKKMEWVAVRTRFGPMISERNKLKRQKFAQMCLDEEDTFDNVYTKLYMNNYSTLSSYTVMLYYSSNSIFLVCCDLHRE